MSESPGRRRRDHGLSAPSDPTDPDGMTQELRFAVVMTGGASLAVWMGGVAREINLLTAPRPDPGDRAAGPPTDPRQLYHRLVDLLRLDVSVDVLSGTSAGAINAAALGYANVSGSDLAPLRDLWLTDGAIDHLLRDPAAASFPSLLQGDAELLSGIRAVLDAIERTAPAPDERPNAPTSVFITTTFLRPEVDTFTDDVGTAVRDADHRGLFSFGEADLVADGARARLALAARASASFPGAFEPAFVPIGQDADEQHPDMAGYVNAARSHFVADGGLLDNRPLRPALEAIFDRPAGRQVRRVLAYVVPTIELPRSAAAPRADQQPTPPGLGRALVTDLDAALNQTIAGDLTRLRGHNTRTRTRRDSRRRLADLRTAAGEPLVDAAGYATYRARQATALCTPVVDALLRMVADRATASLPAGAKEQAGVLTRIGAGTAGLAVAGTDEVLAGAVDRAAAFLPASRPGPDRRAELWRLGRPALDGAVATLLDLVREGYLLATRPADRAELAGFGRLLHDARPRAGAPSPRVVWTVVSEVFATARDRPLPSVVAEATDRWLRLDYADDDRFRDALTHGWSTVGLVARDLRDLLARLIADHHPRPVAPEPLSRASRPGGLSVRERRSLAVDFLSAFVAFLPSDADQAVFRLVDLHLAEVVFADGGAAAAPVELAQLSADTRTLLDPSRDRATQKLTGLQLAHFGAFLKQSWRASDWMWGRLDGAGWLVHLLLDPRRLVALREMAGDADQRAAWAARLRAELSSIAGAGPAPGVEEELAFLVGDRTTVPRSLPATSMWVAAGLQRLIAAEELPVVADAARADRAARGANVAGGFLAAYAAATSSDATSSDDDVDARATDARARVTRAATAPTGRLPVASAESVLRACRVSEETFTAQLSSPMMTSVLARAAAVSAGMIATAGEVPRSLRPALWTLRAITRLVYELTRRVTHGRRDTTTLLALVLLIGGFGLATSTISVIGVVGLLAALVGAGLLVLVVWRRLTQVIAAVGATALVAVAAAGFVPVLKRHLFPWLRDTVVPYLADHPVTWAAVFVLLLVPPVTTLVGLAVHTRSSPSDQETSVQR